MAVCLDYQAVYYDRRRTVSTVQLQVIAVALLVAALTFRVWVQIRSTNVGYQLAALRQEAVELDMQRREFDLQRSVLLRPDNLARAAKARLGLVALNPQHARTMKEN